MMSFLSTLGLEIEIELPKCPLEREVSQSAPDFHVTLVPFGKFFAEYVGEEVRVSGAIGRGLLEPRVQDFGCLRKGVCPTFRGI